MKILSTNVYVGPNQYAHFPVIRHQGDIGALEQWPSARLGEPFIEGLVEALFGFNIGVELGQLLFVFVALGLAWAFTVLRMMWPRWVLWLPGYTVGSLGAYWTIQRVVLLIKAL